MRSGIYNKHSFKKQCRVENHYVRQQWKEEQGETGIKDWDDLLETEERTRKRKGKSGSVYRVEGEEHSLKTAVEPKIVGRVNVPRSPQSGEKRINSGEGCKRSCAFRIQTHLI